MVPSDFSECLKKWYEKGDLPHDDADDLFSAILNADKHELSNVEPKNLLELLEFGSVRQTVADRLRFLEQVRDYMSSPMGLARWRALRVLEPDVPSDVWEAFWNDALSEDELIYADAHAVLLPAIARKDTVFLNAFATKLEELPANGLLRQRLPAQY